MGIQNEFLYRGIALCNALITYRRPEYNITKINLLSSFYIYKEATETDLRDYTYVLLTELYR